MPTTPGNNFRNAVASNKPLQIVGTINAYAALMAKRVGFKAIYLSGAGVANASYGLPDLGMTTLDNVLEDANRIVSAVDLPLLADIDTGWGNAFMIARAIKSMIRAGVAAVHMEDQVFMKRCGHRSGKAIVPSSEMVDRIKAAVDARTDPSFVIMARTDAFAIEGIEKTMDRAIAYREAGADMLFPEALTTLDPYIAIKHAARIPILVNMTEFGVTPLFPIEKIAGAGIDMVLYPLSANRAMNLAALRVYHDIITNGTQQDSVIHMQTREELYEFLNYEEYEKKANHLLNEEIL